MAFRVSVVFIGQLHDRGFNQSGLAGVEAARHTTKAAIEVVAGLPYDAGRILDAAAEAARAADAVIFVGGQGEQPAQRLAPRFPNTHFAVVQSDITGPNLCSYEVLQEQSAFLAGVLAAEISQTGVVGHLSGHRVRPGLKGRAAYATGVAFAGRDVQLLTGFCGTQDESDTARDWTLAMAEAGIDVLFTMLNGARAGAIDACRRCGITQIGNVIDWCSLVPDVFIASALARIDLAVQRAIQDAAAGVLPLAPCTLGLADDGAVGLKVATQDRRLTNYVQTAINRAEQALLTDSISLDNDYAGGEFSP